ncbi:MAG: glycerate kinase, partial [Ornithinibacter sp.]
MRVLIAPDSFGSTLGPVQAATAMAQGWAQGAPHDELELLPLSDGGPGFLDVLAGALGGLTVATTVSDPLGREVPAAVLLVERGGRRTAYVEASQASGLHLLGADERDPGLTSTWGAGQLLEAAVAEGADKVVVGVGGGSTNDAGAGFLAALGAGPASALARGGLALASAPDDVLPGLADVVARFAGVELVLATDDDTPLLGL